MIKNFKFTAEDKRVRKDILPVRIVLKGKGVSGASSLLKSKDYQTTAGADVPAAVMKNGKGGKNAFIVLDFGCEFHGSLRIITSWVNSEGNRGKVRITLGESLTEAMSEIGNKGACNDHSPRDFVREIGMFSDNEYGLGGFRFARIELLSADCEMRIQSVNGVFIYTDLEYMGSFCCNDEKINKIYDVAAYTVHLNIQRYVWDGIKRDRLVWIGDINPEALAIRTVFGRCEEIEKTLDYFRKYTPDGSWMNGMPTYTLWWLITVYDWYLCCGSKGFLNRHKSYVLKIIPWILSFIGEDGSTEKFPGNFLDWPTSELAESADGVRGLICQAIEACGKLAEIYGRGDIAKECEAKAEAIRKVVGNSNGIKTIAAFLYNAGISDSSGDAAEILSDGGANGMSTFMSYYVLKALSNSGHISQALDILKEYYGAMLDLGATTFWEDFNIEWADNAVRIDELPDDSRPNIHSDFGGYCYKGLRHSLCHGWSAGPVPFLNDFVLGIKITEAGCRSVEIKGNLGSLEWAEGTFPTPYGILYVRHEKDKDGKIKTEYKAPAGVKVTVKE